MSSLAVRLAILSFVGFTYWFGFDIGINDYNSKGNVI